MHLCSFQSTVAPGQGLGSGSSSQACRQNTRNRQKETRNLPGNKKLSESAAGAARTSDARADLPNQDLRDLGEAIPKSLGEKTHTYSICRWVRGVPAYLAVQAKGQSGPGTTIHGSAAARDPPIGPIQRSLLRGSRIEDPNSN